MHLVADLHTHSIASGHAYSTIAEMMKAASEKGLLALGLTDHGSAMPDGPHDYYFSNLSALPREMFGVHLYRAAEANIINLDGDLDLWPETQARLDYLIASMHIRGVSPEGHSAEQTTQMWKNAMKNPYVKILGHPENIPFPIILEEFVAEAKAHRKIIEVNSSSYVTRPNSVGVLEQLVAEAKRQEALMVITSDAHFAGAVAKFDRALELVQKLGVSEELIVNTSLEQLERHVFTKNDCLCWKPMFTRERERL